jgi:hypothetical protein
VLAWNAAFGAVGAPPGAGADEGAAVEGRTGAGEATALDVPAPGAGRAEMLGEIAGAVGEAASRLAQPAANRPSKITAAARAITGRVCRRAARWCKHNAIP